MVSHHDHTESFHGPHVQAELVCSDIANRLDLAWDRVVGESLPSLVDADVLWQPLDVHGLLPFGPAITLLHESVRLIPSADGSRSRGTLWLPRGIARRDVPRCYFRIHNHFAERDDHEPHTQTTSDRSVAETSDEAAQKPCHSPNFDRTGH